MAELYSARPERESVRAAQPFSGGLLDHGSARSWTAVLSANRLEIAAIAHLTLLAAVEFKSSTGGATSLLVLSGVMLVLLALMHNGGVFNEASAVFIPVEAPSEHGNYEGRVMSAQELSLERQSQRLVEIADTAMRTRLQSEQRGQAWADLMARVSHELRTPLNAVIGFTDLMKSEVLGPVGHPRYMEYLDHIQDSGRTLLKSAEDTLALTALLAAPGTAAKDEVLNLADFATEAWAFTSLDARARNIFFETSGLDLDVLGERRPLRQILINLYSCALARAANGATISLVATSDGGVVDLTLSVSKLATTIPYDTGCLSLNLARALLDLQDSFLLEPPAPSGTWRAVTAFAAASQADFFA
jgi:signal transduction histidine kinase